MSQEEPLELLGVGDYLQRMAAPVDEDYELHESLVALQYSFSRLDPKERQALKLRFGLGWDRKRGFWRTRDEVGREMGLSGERIRQIECSALKKLRRWLLPKPTPWEQWIEHCRQEEEELAAARSARPRRKPAVPQWQKDGWAFDPELLTGDEVRP